MEARQCDWCGVARAYVWFVLHDGRDLAACIHHADEALPKIAPLCVTILDQRHQLLEHA